MDILIINLQSQAVRRDFQTRQMQALGLQWERPCLILEDDAAPGLLRNLEHRTGHDLVNLEVQGREKIAGWRALTVQHKARWRHIALDVGRFG